MECVNGLTFILSHPGQFCDGKTNSTLMGNCGKYTRDNEVTVEDVYLFLSNFSVRLERSAQDETWLAAPSEHTGLSKR